MSESAAIDLASEIEKRLPPSIGDATPVERHLLAEYSALETRLRGVKRDIADIKALLVGLERTVDTAIEAVRQFKKTE